jgi:Caspase domain
MRHLLAAIAVALLAGPAVAAPEKGSQPNEAARVRFLIVADTDAREGAACGLDAGNLKAVLEAGLKKQKLDGRYTIDTLSGRDVTANRVLKYYEGLKVGANDALVFYYSGHGAYSTKKGHLLTFLQGDLARANVLTAMQRHKPRLTVVLTDCCAVYDDLNVAKPIPPPKGAAPVLPGKRSFSFAFDPPQQVSGSPPRPKDYVPPSAGAVTPVPELPHPPRPENYRPPPPFDLGPDDHVPGGDGVVLRTADGPVLLKSVVEQTDGELLRHLFYRHTGVVDVNGCQKGKAAYATTRWGGGLFTVSFLALQKDKAAEFDANRNGLVEWSEFFAAVRSNCNRAASKLSNGKMHQVPEATKLGHSTVQLATQ